MAFYEEEKINKQIAEEKIIVEQRKGEANERYGEALGNAFYDFVYEGHSSEEIEENEEAFITEVSIALNSGNPVHVEVGVDALVKSFSRKIEIAERRTANSPGGSMVI